MRIALLADVGQPVYHVGDEAMGHAAHDELVRRGAEVVVLTRDPEHTRRHFGAGTATARTLEVPWPPAARERYRSEIDRVLAGDTAALPAHDQVFGLVEALRGCTGLLVAGGGNINSTYGWLLEERAAVAAVARSLGLPVVVSGQTLGPVLTARDREVVAGLLRTARLAGLREGRSLALARDLAPDARLVQVLDDASFLVAPRPAAAPVSATFGAVPAALAGADLLRPLARRLETLADLAGAPVQLVPHMATPGAGDGDEAVHAHLAGLCAPGTVDPLPVEDARTAAARAAGARLVVSSRYHPVVFGLAGGATTVGLVPDDYGMARIRGALGNWGVQPAAALPLFAVRDDRTDAALREAWASADATRARLDALRPAFVERAHRWWDAVAVALSGREAAAPAVWTTSPVTLAPALDRLAADHEDVVAVTAELARVRAEEDAASSALGLARERADAAVAELERVRATRAFRLASTAWRVRGARWRR